MAVTVEWANLEKTILMTTYHVGWSWAELTHLSAASQTPYLDAVEHPVYLIEVLEGRVPMPKVGWTYDINEEGIGDHPNFAGAVVVTTSRIAPMLANIFKLTAPGQAHKLHLATTVEEALTLINQMIAKRAESF